MTQDWLSHFGYMSGRRGFTFDGTTADSATAISGIVRNKFILAGATRTITNCTTGTPQTQFFIHNPSSAGTAIGTVTHLNGSQTYLPRAVYNDEVLFCCQDGLTPVVRYAGGNTSGGTGSEAGATWTASRATISGHTFASIGKGAFWYTRQTVLGGTLRQPSMHWKVIEEGTASHTIQNVFASATAVVTAFNSIGPIANSYPCVNIYDAGTVSVTANVATGSGTKWNTAASYSTPSTGNDSMLFMPATGNRRITGQFAPTTDTSANLVACPNQTETPYAILRSCPFKDVAVHRGSLWGSGVAMHPSRVYVAPPGWDMSLPPGATLPFDPTTEFASALNSAYMLDFIDVPAIKDGDPVVAILPSNDPLLVLKRRSVYGLYGSWPAIEAGLVADGIGCIDIRSAISVDEGAFWAGDTGIFWYRDGRLNDLTEGRINREWRNLVAAVTGALFCTSGVVRGHLQVYIEGTGISPALYVFNLTTGAVSKFSNMRPRAVWSSRVPDEPERLYWSGPTLTNGRVAESSNVWSAAGTSNDAAGSGPTPQATFPATIDGGDISTDTKLHKVEMVALLTDTAGTATFSVAHFFRGGALGGETINGSQTLTSGANAITAGIGVNFGRYFRRDSNRPGRYHYLTFAQDAAATSTLSPPEIHELSFRFTAADPET